MSLPVKALRWTLRGLALVLSLGSAWGAWVVADAALAACQGSACPAALAVEAPRVLLLALAGLAGTWGLLTRGRRLLRGAALLFSAAWLAKPLAHAWLGALAEGPAAFPVPLLDALSSLAIPVGLVSLLLLCASWTYREDASRGLPPLAARLRQGLDALAEGPA